MVLVFFTDTRKVADDLDAELAEELAIANTRALEDLGSTESTRAEDNHLAGLDLEHTIPVSRAGGPHELDTYDGLLDLATVSAVAG